MVKTAVSIITVILSILQSSLDEFRVFKSGSVCPFWDQFCCFAYIIRLGDHFCGRTGPFWHRKLEIGKMVYEKSMLANPMRCMRPSGPIWMKCCIAWKTRILYRCLAALLLSGHPEKTPVPKIKASSYGLLVQDCVIKGTILLNPKGTGGGAGLSPSEVLVDNFWSRKLFHQKFCDFS